MKDSPSAPPAPDYAGAAKQQQLSSMVSQYTPYGNMTYSQDPNAPSGYSSNISLAPQAQSALDNQLQFSNQMGNLGMQQLGQVQSQGQPDLSSVNQVADKAYGAMTSRLDPQWHQNQQSFDAKMADQGIPVGSEAYNNANREFQQSKNDAYQQANLGAIQTMPQTYGISQDIYNQPLNRFNAFRTGAQVQNPTFQQPGAGANLFGAAQAQGQYGQGLYNAQVGQQNAMMGGLFGLGGSLGAASILAPAAVSDRRLKREIKKLWNDARGFGVYAFKYLWGDEERIGVMADEVERVNRKAVLTLPSGFKAVNYGML